MALVSARAHSQCRPDLSDFTTTPTRTFTATTAVRAYGLILCGKWRAMNAIQGRVPDYEQSTPGTWHAGSEPSTGLRSWVPTGDVWDYAGWTGGHLPDVSTATPQSLIARSNNPPTTADAHNSDMRFAPTSSPDLSSSDSLPHVYGNMGAPQPTTAADPAVEAQAGLRCLWGGRCGALLPNATVQEIRAHLREAHGVPGRDRTARIPCLWDGRCSRSSDCILPGGMGKHVATCHFKIMRRSCASCGQAFCRQDSLVRHEYLYCPKLRGDRRKKKRPSARRVVSDMLTR